MTRTFDVFFEFRLNKGLVNNRDAADLRRHLAHYDTIVMDLSRTGGGDDAGQMSRTQENNSAL